MKFSLIFSFVFSIPSDILYIKSAIGRLGQTTHLNPNKPTLAKVVAYTQKTTDRDDAQEGALDINHSLEWRCLF